MEYYTTAVVQYSMYHSTPYCSHLHLPIISGVLGMQTTSQVHLEAVLYSSTLQLHLICHICTLQVHLYFTGVL